MTTVDNRVVELDFNNKEFEQGVKQSSKSLEQMKKNLNFDESAKSLSNLSRTSKNFSLSTMAEGVQGISNRFSTLGIVGMTVIQNLTNAAIRYGKQMISNLTKPMKEGFQEYETQMNAIQTVLANTESKGTTLEDVSAALDELNTYADQTIYNFTEMTRNIGTFTAAGVDLETSTAAIKGIANLAAVSGSNSQQASTAMYQLSQALSSGTVKLMDWNSVVNAGMGGQVFQDALKETARVSGIAIDDLIDKHGSFRETLSTGWLSSEVLLNTLQKFTGDLNTEQLKTMGYTEEQIEGILKLGQTANDAATKVKTFTQLKETLQEAIQSGWTKSWEIVIGDFEEAKAVFTEISDTLGALIGSSADARNKLLQDWKDAGGRGVLISSLRNAFEALLLIMKPIKEAWAAIFPPTTGEQLAQLTDKLWMLTRALKINSEQADQIKRFFLGVFSTFALGIDIIKTIAGALWDFAQVLYGMSGANITSGGVLEFLATLGDKLVALREGVNLEALGKAIWNVLFTIMSYLHRFKYGVLNIIEEVKTIFSNMFEGVNLKPVQDFFGGFEISFRPFETLLKGVGFIIGAILKGASKLIPVLFNVGQSIFEFIVNLGNMIADVLSNIDFTQMFSTINVGLMSAILLAIRNFISSGSGVLNEVGGVFEGVVDLLDGVRGSLEAWQQNLKSKTLLNIAIAVGILAASLLVLSFIDADKLASTMLVLTGMFVQLISAQAAFSKFGTGGLGASASLVLMATSLLILAGAIYILAKLDKEAMQEGIGTIYALLAGMAIFSKFMSANTGSMLKGAVGMIGVSLAILALAVAVKALGNMDADVLKKGLISIGVMLAQIAIFMRLVDDKGPGKTLGLLAMAGALVILSMVVEKFGQMDINELQQGLLAIGAVLLGLAAFTRISGDGKGMITTSIGVVILAAALEIFVDVIKKLGNMSIESLAKGLGGMAIALTIIAIALRAIPKSAIVQAAGILIMAAAIKIISEAVQNMGSMSWEEIGKGLATLAGAMLILAVGLYAMSGTMAGSVALLVAAGALAILTPVLQALGQMPLSEIGIALLALAGVFTVLGIAGLVLTPLVPTLLSLGLAMLLIGVGVALIGAGLLAFSTGLLALAAGGTAAAIGIVAFVTTLLGLLPVIAKTLIDTLIVFAQGIAKAAPEIANAITAMMLGFLQVIIDTSPKIFETLDVLLKGLIQLIVDNIPEFVEATLELLVTMLQSIADKMPDFVQAGWDILIAFLEGIRDNIAEVVVVVVEIVTEFLGAVAEKIPDIIQAGWDLMIAFIDGMAEGIDNNMQPALDAIGRLATAIIDGLLAGIAKGASKIIEALVNLAKDAYQAAKDWLFSNSPSKRFIPLGEGIPEGLLVGIQNLAAKVPKAVKELAMSTLDGVKGVSKDIARILESDLEMDPTIRPIVDMSEIETAGNLIDSLFGAQQLSLVPAISTSSRIASDISRNREFPADQINTANNFNYVQNNYSPKPLSRIDIYRQTKNLLLPVKGLAQS